MISDFCAEYLRLQGIEVLRPVRRQETHEVRKREGEFVPRVPMYERGDLP